MNKAIITSPAAMSEEQIKEDIAMTPLERLTLAFKISDFALELRPDNETIEEESSSIQWIELRKISSSI
jgi:hypothetical protein